MASLTDARAETTQAAAEPTLYLEASNLGARFLIASYYIASATGLTHNPSAMTGAFAGEALPAHFLWPDIGFQILAASFILLGFQTRLAAALLALHVFWSTFILNFQPGVAEALGLFWKDLVIVGGLLMIISHGDGRFALDTWLRRRAAERRSAEATEAAEQPKPASFASARREPPLRGAAQAQPAE